MDWQKIRSKYPHQWAIVEGVREISHSDLPGIRTAGLTSSHIISLRFVSAYRDAESANQALLNLRSQSPRREVYLVHTDVPSLDIDDLQQTAKG